MPDRVATAWLLQYSSKDTLVQVQNAGHLETWYGERIRKDMPEGTTDGAVLKQWLLGHLSVSANARVCQKWLSTEWGAKGALNTAPPPLPPWSRIGTVDGHLPFSLACLLVHAYNFRTYRACDRLQHGGPCVCHEPCIHVFLSLRLAVHARVGH